MTYKVRFTDSDKAELTVYDNTANNDTSLVFPGRNVTNYGSIIAENFLHLLENFSSASAPVSPIEGQLWYDSLEESLKVNDGVTWRAASGIYKDSVAPSLDSSKAGELWIDTVNQQLKIFNGSSWVLVGPNRSTIGGLKYGPVVETVSDTDNNEKSIVIIYIADVPVIIISKDTFTPRAAIPGFSGIRAGINVNLPTTPADIAQFGGGSLPKLIGTATAAETLVIEGTDTVVPASKVLRSNVINTVDAQFKVKDNTGITIGVDQTFNLGSGIGGARIYNSTSGGSINFQINRGGTPDTILKIKNNLVGINNQDPKQALDVVGRIKASDVIETTSTTLATSTSIASIVTQGGIGVKENIIVGSNVELNANSGYTTSRDIYPVSSGVYNLGKSDSKWNEIIAKTIVADNIQINGSLESATVGNALTADELSEPVKVKIRGDVSSEGFDINFKGNEGVTTGVTIQTVLTSNIISGKNESPGGVSLKTDEVLIYRPSSTSTGFSGLLKQTRDNFIADLGIPIGAILPYAGTNPPAGFLFCDGSEVQKSQYPELYSVINDYYNGSTPLATAPFNTTFRLPDLRGRFPLGRDNMDNGGTVPIPTGGSVNAGGGPANRVSDAEASTIAGSKGSSTKTLGLDNVPDHSHSLTSSNGQQFYALRNDPATVPGTIAGPAGTSSGQTRLLPDSGTITKPSSGFQFGRPFDAMNPYLTLNYIIRSGPPAFSVN